MLHAKAKEDPERRFHALIDKVWRMDVLTEAWSKVRRNGGVDGEAFDSIELHGVERWLGGNCRNNTGRGAVRQVLIPKTQPGRFRPLGRPCIWDRVAQASAMLVLEPVLEADLQAEP